jgi:putative addiction module component (TIGR02574 family)
MDMSQPAKRLESEILALPQKERARLAQLILVSLEETGEGTTENLEAAWAEEIERRVAELRSGAVALLPGEQVLKEVEDLTK